MTKSKLYTISELAEQLGINTHQVRYYANKGIITPKAKDNKHTRRGAGHYKHRFFTTKDIKTLRDYLDKKKS